VSDCITSDRGVVCGVKRKRGASHSDAWWLTCPLVSADTACCASTLAARSRSSDMFGRPVSEFTSCLQSTQLQCADVTHQLAQDVLASRASDRLTSSQLSLSATCERGAWMSINAANTAGFLVCVQLSVFVCAAVDWPHKRACAPPRCSPAMCVRLVLSQTRRHKLTSHTHAICMLRCGCALTCRGCASRETGETAPRPVNPTVLLV
jgi:hypothetical protein